MGCVSQKSYPVSIPAKNSYISYKNKNPEQGVPCAYNYYPSPYPCEKNVYSDLPFDSAVFRVINSQDSASTIRNSIELHFKRNYLSRFYISDVAIISQEFIIDYPYVGQLNLYNLMIIKYKVDAAENYKENSDLIYSYDKYSYYNSQPCLSYNCCEINHLRDNPLNSEYEYYFEYKEYLNGEENIDSAIEATEGKAYLPLDGHIFSLYV